MTISCVLGHKNVATNEFKFYKGEEKQKAHQFEIISIAIKNRRLVFYGHLKRMEGVRQQQNLHLTGKQKNTGIREEAVVNREEYPKRRRLRK